MLSILEKAALGAGEIALASFQRELSITRKTSHQNLVTQADAECQAFIKKIITDELALLGVQESEIGFVGEENLHTQGTKHLFIIDPIDGTNNFASGLDYFCTSIAHWENGAPKEALIYWPSRNTCYFAEAGKGAYKKRMGQSPIALSIKEELLENCILFSYISSDKKYREMFFNIIEKIFPHIRGVRINGSMCLDLARLCERENATHMVLSFRGYIWDVAAAYLLVQESGGVFANFDGSRMEIDSIDPNKHYSFIAAHSNVVKYILPLLRS